VAEAWLARDGRVVPGPGSTGHLGFRYAVVDGPGEAVFEDAPEGFEAAVVLVQSAGVVEARRGTDVIRLGVRPSPFDDPPEAAYLPDGGRIVVRADRPAVVALAWAAGGGASPAYAVHGADVALETRGSGPDERTIRHLLEADRPANRLYLVEVLTPAAHWSSFPPHRHDEHAPPGAYAMEEAYLFRVDPPAHRALMGTWTADGRETAGFVVGDGDLVMVRSGYHTVSAAPGSRLYYLNAMAGPERVWTPVFHPDYLHLVRGWSNAPVARADG